MLARWYGFVPLGARRRSRDELKAVEAASHSAGRARAAAVDGFVRRELTTETNGGAGEGRAHFS